MKRYHLNSSMARSRVTPKQLQALRERAKVQLQRDMNVEKAAELMAQEQLILMDESIPPALKTAQFTSTSLDSESAPTVCDDNFR